MSTIETEIASILSQAEKQLRRVIAEAAARGDYSGVDKARQVAVEVQEIGDRGKALHSMVSPAISLAQASSKNANKEKGRKGNAGSYPQFRVENDTLTKIGWSKKEKKEYIHRVSRGVFEQTLQTMVSLANGEAGPFMAEQIIERLNKSASDFTPSYQVYIVIAFLRKARCIRQEGRDGYSIFPELVARAGKAWVEARGTS